MYSKVLSLTVLSFVVIAMLSLVPIDEAYAAEGEVAQIGGIGYSSVSSAVDSASEGSTIVLIGDVSEDVVILKGKSSP